MFLYVSVNQMFFIVVGLLLFSKLRRGVRTYLLMTDPSDKHMNFILFFRVRRPTAAQRELVATISRFQRRIKGAVIDVWWLYDDGGLTLLIPHLLTLPKRYLEVSVHLKLYLHRPNFLHGIVSLTHFFHYEYFHWYTYCT